MGGSGSTPAFIINSCFHYRYSLPQNAKELIGGLLPDELQDAEQELEPYFLRKTLGSGHGILGTGLWTWGTGHVVLNTGNRIRGTGLRVIVTALPNTLKGLEPYFLRKTLGSGHGALGTWY